MDQLLGYDYGEADGTRLVPNPERKRIERELKAKRQELPRQRTELGQALLDESRWGRIGHGIKIAQGGSVGRLRALEQEIAKLQERRAELPKHVPLSEVGTREVLRLKQKAMIDSARPL